MSAKTSALWHHFDDLEHQHEANVLGMWVFLATELLIFGGLFTGYTVYRLQSVQHAASFEAASGHLNLPIAAINTVVLLTSSLTMALAVRAARLGQRNALTVTLLLTAVLGAAFLGLKAVEYMGDYREHLIPGVAFEPDKWRHNPVNPENVQLFLVFYYVMTGLHAVHLTLGIGIVLVLTFMAWRGLFSKEWNTPIEMWGLYWHFVDVVWIFVLPLLYLIGTHGSH